MAGYIWSPKEDPNAIILLNTCGNKLHPDSYTHILVYPSTLVRAFL